jgi:hypothetical protein
LDKRLAMGRQLPMPVLYQTLRCMLVRLLLLGRFVLRLARRRLGRLVRRLGRLRSSGWRFANSCVDTAVGSQRLRLPNLLLVSLCSALTHVRIFKQILKPVLAWRFERAAVAYKHWLAALELVLPTLALLLALQRRWLLVLGGFSHLATAQRDVDGCVVCVGVPCSPPRRLQAAATA